jgi:AcrR family transcriptional regulator
MSLHFSIKPNDKLALRNPEATELGQKIVRQGLILMNELGYEQFTFKKLAEAIGTTEASLYRYFENKHRLLLYFLTLYWSVLEYTVLVSLQNLNKPEEKIRKIVEVLAYPIPDWVDASGFDTAELRSLAIAEGNKTYLVREVDVINQERLFKPYKDLCGAIAGVFTAYNAKYLHARSLASTVIEMSQLQHYFSQHLPLLTNVRKSDTDPDVASYLESLIFASLR